MGNQPRSPGRPRHYADEVKREPLNIRTTRALKDALVAAARRSGHSLAQEIEFRLWRSLQDDEFEAMRQEDPEITAMTSLAKELVMLTIALERRRRAKPEAAAADPQPAKKEA
jgi:hypothetical protein